MEHELSGNNIMNNKTPGERDYGGKHFRNRNKGVENFENWDYVVENIVDIGYSVETQKDRDSGEENFGNGIME